MNLSDDLDRIGDGHLLLEMAAEIHHAAERGDLVDCVSCFLEAATGRWPSEIERQASAALFVCQEPEHFYRLCDGNGKPLEFSPRVYLDAGEVEQANKELTPRKLKWRDVPTIEKEEAARKEKRAQEWAAEQEANRDRPTAAEYQALREFIKTHGRVAWRRLLRKQWADGTAPAPLLVVRDHPKLGEKWLTEYKLGKWEGK